MENLIEILNLPPKTTQDQIYQLCISFGPIYSISIGSDNKLRSFSKARVSFSGREDAIECYRNLNGLKFFDSHLITTVLSLE